MAELGLAQLEPTVIWQDNQSGSYTDSDEQRSIGKEVAGNGLEDFDTAKQGGRHEMRTDLP
jgi:hypothetical protein